jgi:putative ABC transport system permease protein
VMGAGGGLVMLQAWLEAMLLTLAALALAIGILVLASPALEATMSVNMIYFLTRGPEAWSVIAAIVAAVAFVAGSYPALVLSRVRPADALRSGKSRSGPGFVARILVGVQFASASFLLILVTVAQDQRTHLEKLALAPHADPIVALNDLRPLGMTVDTLETELRGIPGVKSVSVTDRLPWTTRASIMNFVRTPDAAVAASPSGYLKQVGYDYFETLDLKLVAGRVFDRQRDTRPTILMGDNGPDPIALVVDESYAAALGFEAPAAAVGQVVYMPMELMRSFGRPPQAARIIGVTETDRMRMSGPGIMHGHMYIYATGGPAISGHIPLVKIAAENFPQTMDAIRRAWSRLSPEVPLNPRFLDALFEQGYRQYARISQLFMGLALAAFLIASIGLLGIAVHVAVKRRHEVAVRKTLGSSASRVVGLLLTDFSKPIIIGNLLSWPLAWVAANAYLAAFTNRIDLTIAPFLISMGLTLVIAWAAVIGVVVKAATVRPAEVLRRA